MLEVADIFRLHGAAYRAHVGERLPASHTRALADIQACRTATFGGHIDRCDHCGREVYVYHSCGNRSCPKCHREQTERWIDKQRARLLPCRYYLLTFTLPEPLRPLALAHQREIYGFLMRAAAAALQKLARDPRYVGARLGCMAVLHTWTRAMQYHPHVHMLVTAGGLSADGSEWREPKHAAFLVPVEALSVIFRAKMCAALKRAGWLGQVPPAIWKKKWVVHCQPAGRGQKVLEYLGRYVFRVAITNSRLERINQSHVTFRYRDNRSQEMRHVTVTGVEFIRRFLLHVLPRGCKKVRYYGIWSGSRCDLLDKAQTLLAVSSADAALEKAADLQSGLASPARPISNRCPYCKVGHLIPIQVLYPQRKRSP
jgi:Putative transposase/Transposase zinc-binding domain